MEQFCMPTYPACDDVWQYLRRTSVPFVVWGMGNGADKLVARMERMGLSVADFIASDGFVRGQSFHGKKVLRLADVKEKYDSFVILLAFATAREDVLKQIFQTAKEFPVLMPDLPVCGDIYFDAEFYNAHYEAFCAVYQNLADETSRSIFAATLQYKLTGDIDILRRAHTDPMETNTLLDASSIHNYVDCGAYNGDTIRALLAAGAPLERVVCMEPDRRNFKKLEQYVASLSNCKVHAVRAGTWDEDTDGFLAGSGNRNSSFAGASYENKTEQVPLFRVDTLCKDFIPDYIKYDVEGSEEKAILGTAKTIETSHPRLLVSLYHRTEDLYVLPQLLARIGSYYNFYLRRLLCVPAWELNLICLPL